MRPKRVHSTAAGRSRFRLGDYASTLMKVSHTSAPTAIPTRAAIAIRIRQMQNDGLMVSHGRQSLYPA